MGLERVPFGFCGRRNYRRAEKQIPCGNDRKKSYDKGKSRSRFPAGMTERKARATTKATTKAEADPCDQESA
jgi:hypothetical protein